jgi:hypothetical protein
MAYTEHNYKSKKALKEALANGERVKCYQPGGLFPLKPGTVYLEGPHYPKPPRWYATAKVDNNLYIIPGSVK